MIDKPRYFIAQLNPDTGGTEWNLIDRRIAPPPSIPSGSKPSTYELDSVTNTSRCFPPVRLVTSLSLDRPDKYVIPRNERFIWPLSRRKSSRSCAILRRWIAPVQVSYDCPDQAKVAPLGPPKFEFTSDISPLRLLLRRKQFVDRKKNNFIL